VTAEKESSHSTLASSRSCNLWYSFHNGIRYA